CSAHYYGIYCDQRCGACLNDAPCDKQTGECDVCEPGWKPTPLCDEEETSSSLVGPVVGAIVGGFAVLGIILLVPVILCLRRYRASRSAGRAQGPVDIQLSGCDDKQFMGDSSRTTAEEADSQPGAGPDYENIEGGNTYESLQPVDQDETSVYTQPNFERDSSKDKAVHYVNVEHRNGSDSVVLVESDHNYRHKQGTALQPVRPHVTSTELNAGLKPGILVGPRRLVFLDDVVQVAVGGLSNREIIAAVFLETFWTRGAVNVRPKQSQQMDI
ncbi:hypothetical protein BaRGS_00032254, partial [Batillaria attramentaria]